jgi:hypothetical protein
MLSLVTLKWFVFRIKPYRIKKSADSFWDATLSTMSIPSF